MWALLLSLGAGLPPGAFAQAAGPAAPAQVQAEQPPVIRAISWHALGLVVQASAPLEPQSFTLTGPDRFVVDLPNAELADATLAAPIAIADGTLKQVRLAQKLNAVRLVIDCNGPTAMQVIPLGDRLLIVRADQADLALEQLRTAEGAPLPHGQEIRSLWSRETVDTLSLHLRGAQNLGYSLFEADTRHLEVRVPRGRFAGYLPLPGRHLEGAHARVTPDGTWVLDLALAAGHYQLATASQAGGGELTLTFTRVEPRRFPDSPLVVIDPGHGGKDPGALGPDGTLEKDDCLALAKALQQVLWQRGLNAILTRSSDAELYLAPRLAVINEQQADLFVSLHANSHISPVGTGTETFWREPFSQVFAESIHRAVTGRLGRPDRGVKQERLYVLRHPRVPSALLETGFISNPTEARLLSSPSFQEQAADAIACGIEAYLDAPIPPLGSLTRPIPDPGKLFLSTQIGRI